MKSHFKIAIIIIVSLLFLLFLSSPFNRRRLMFIIIIIIIRDGVCLEAFFAPSGLNVATHGFNADFAQKLNPQNLLIGQPVVGPFDLDDAKPFPRRIPQGQIRESGSGEAVISQQPSAYFNQLFSGETQQKSG